MNQFENLFLSLQSDHFFPDASKGKYAAYYMLPIAYIVAL